MKEATLHIDGDSFFASCEISLNPKLKGLPVVTGQERGIVTAMSKEAKALGIPRGMPIFQLKKLYPHVVIVNSNYHAYGIFAQRMYNIVRRYTSEVEEQSIDECFAFLREDMRGLTSIIDTAKKIKDDLNRELGMTFSIGVGPTKVIAKVASKWNKPDGFTVINPEDIHEFLKDMQVGKIWGIGPSTSTHLLQQGIKTALDLIARPQEWIYAAEHKHIRELWHELRGTRVYNVHTHNEDDQSSIQKTRTFTPPTHDKSTLFSELSKNVEGACFKARKHGLLTRRIYYFLKTQEFRYHRKEIVLLNALSNPNDILEAIGETFDEVYRPYLLYRATGVILSDLVSANQSQHDLFGASRHIDT